VQQARITLATPRFKIKGPNKLRSSREFDTLKISRKPARNVDNSTYLKGLKFHDSQNMKVRILTHANRSPSKIAGSNIIRCLLCSTTLIASVQIVIQRAFQDYDPESRRRQGGTHIDLHSLQVPEAACVSETEVSSSGRSS
jgi:hypothetical protein